jgi:lipid A 3-O-deacylase
MHCSIGRSLLVTASLFLVISHISLAQDSGPEEGGQEIQAWGAGGHSVFGGIGHTSVFNAGVRYGWILTDPHLPSFLRGRFEYAVDGIPVFIVHQPLNTAYGVSFDPLVLKWNFVRRGRLSPYAELSGGALFTNVNVPSYTNTVNFTPSAAFGTHILSAKYNWSVEVRYLHISNAGLATPNPGLNTVQVRVGVGRFWQGRH